MLGAAPRAILHEALTAGGALGPGVCAEGSKGLGPWSEDAAVAYQLLLQVLGIVCVCVGGGVAMWLEGWWARCLVVGGGPPYTKMGAGDAIWVDVINKKQHDKKRLPSSSFLFIVCCCHRLVSTSTWRSGLRGFARSMGPRHLKKKRHQKPQWRRPPQSPASERCSRALAKSTSPKGLRKPPRCRYGGANHQYWLRLTVHPQQEETAAAKQFAQLPKLEQTAMLRVLAARFSCAVAELQLVGVCHQSKQRRRGATVQRKVFLPSVLVCGQ